MAIAAPVSNWAPDGADLDGNGSIEALNVIPKERGYGPVPTFGAVTNALTARCQGHFFARKSDTTGVVFAGDATKLYRLAVGGATWSDVSRTVGGAYNCPNDGRWSFVQFGVNVLAFNGSDVPQIFNVDIATNFSALGGSSPTALYVAVVGDFVMAANLGALGRSTVQWSAINNCQDWVTSQTTEADNQILPDGGSVQALFGYNYSATILQEFGIKVATYEGPNLIFRFAKISEGLGCSIPGSAAAYNDLCIFYSHTGFQKLQANSVLTPIGEQRVNAWFKRNLNQTYAYRCCAAIDPIRNVYVLGFPDQTSGGQINHFLTYHYLLNQFTHGQPGNMEWINTGTTQAPWTIEMLAATYGTIEAVPFPFDSVVWMGTGIPMLGGFDTSHQMGYFNGPNAPATVSTQEMNLVDGKKAFVRGIRPLVEGGNLVSYSPGPNVLPNPNASGAVPGTPGTPPTGWYVQEGAGIISQIVGSGTDTDIPYVDVSFFGTATADSYLAVGFKGPLSTSITDLIVVGAGQIWNLSCSLKLAAGSLAGISIMPAVDWDEYDSGGNYLATTPYGNGITPSGTWQTSTTTQAIGAGTAGVDTYFVMTAPNGAVVNVTLRIGSPVFALAQVMTSALSMSLGTRNLQTDQIVYGTVVPMDQFGYCRFRSKARYHNAQIMIAGGAAWDVVLGASDPLFVPFGTR